ncbi:galactose-binding domain-like protein [Lipomyces oligophaga]|uniref:galactose-binding domain-like protein n=1 Tax=Lipomyces oligophaga TaxID=45792 RepID=UPI0034CE8182
MSGHNNHSHSHSHSHGGDEGADHSHSHDPVLDTFDSQSLYQQIQHEQVWTMNESEPDQGRQVLKPWNERYDTEKILESDADEQLLMYIPFTGLVKLYSIFIRSIPDDTAPQTIKIFKNRDDLDFSTAMDLEGDETITHVGGSSDVDIVEYPLKRSKFSNARSVTLFVVDNYGAETTMLTYIGFRGEWKQLSKDPIITIYEAAANPKDHKIDLPGESKSMTDSF